MAAVDDLTALLARDAHQLDRLAELLENERTCLAQSDLSALDALAREKNDLLGALSERANLKTRALIRMGYRPEAGDPARFIRSAGFSELLALWQDAENKLQACQALNQTNGRVIGHLQKRLSGLIDIFRGTTGQQALYGAQGQQDTVPNRTILANA